MDKQSVSFKDVFLSAVVLALANMGDAFLYAYLPANYLQTGISSFWVAVILSVNRFTRLFLNGRVAWFLSSKGIKAVFVIAAVTASVTTMLYGFIDAVPLWILARVLWGISFSTLRLGNTLYALEHPRKGMALGLGRAMIELGPVIALLVCPFLLQFAGRSFTFLILGLISMAGILLVLPMRSIQTGNVSKKELLLSFPSSFNVLVLISAFITEGVLVVLVVKLLQVDQTQNPVSPLVLTGLLLGYRRLSLVLFSPLAGWLADQYGFHKVFMYTIIFSAAGLLLILSGATITGIMVIFTFSAMNASTATGGAINTRYSLVKNVSDNATWRDIGTAIGAFTGALLLPVFDFKPVMILLFLLYAAGLLYHRVKFKTNKVQACVFLWGCLSLLCI